MSSGPSPPAPPRADERRGTGRPALLLALLLPPPPTPLELRAADLADGGRPTLRLDACATLGPLLQVREGGRRRAVSGRGGPRPHPHLPEPASSADSPGEGSWVQDWWVDEEAGVVVLVDRRTRALASLLQTGERGRLSAEVMEERLNEHLWPRQQLRPSTRPRPDPAASARRSVLGTSLPPVCSSASGGSMSAYGDDSGKRYVSTAGPARRSGPPAVAGHWRRPGAGPLRRRRPCATGLHRPCHERPHDAAAARQYAIRPSPRSPASRRYPNYETVCCRPGGPRRSAPLRCAVPKPKDDPRAARLAEVARWTGVAPAPTTMAHRPESSRRAWLPDRYIAGEAIRTLLARDGASRMRCSDSAGTPHDGLVAPTSPPTPASAPWSRSSRP